MHHDWKHGQLVRKGAIRIKYLITRVWHFAWIVSFLPIIGSMLHTFERTDPISFSLADSQVNRITKYIYYA